MATAYYLQQHGLPYRVLERERIGEAWRNHYDSLRLHTLKQLSHLPGLAYPADTDTFPTRLDFLRHQERYAATFGLNIREGVAVEEATFTGGRWRLETGAGQMETDTLIAATGIWSNPKIPEFPGMETFRGQVLHGNDYHAPEPFIGKRVLVVGVGNTGADVATELGRAGVETGIVVKFGVNFVPYPSSPTGMEVAAWLFRHLPAAVGDPLLDRSRSDFSDIGLPKNPLPATQAYPVVGFKLVEAVRDDIVTTYPGIERVCAEGVRFEDGAEEPFDTLIMATGYRPALEFLAEDVLARDERGWPVVDEYYCSTRTPRLYAIGYEYPATAGWIQHTRRAARRMVRHIARVS